MKPEIDTFLATKSLDTANFVRFCLGEVTGDGCARAQWFCADEDKLYALAKSMRYQYNANMEVKKESVGYNAVFSW